MLHKFLIILIFLVGCTKTTQESPQKVLTTYVSSSFAINSISDKNKLIGLTTGEVREALEKLDEDSFKNYFIDSKKEFLSLKIKDERKLSDVRYSITYEITYISKSSLPSALGGGQTTDKVTNKKHALFTNQAGRWFISEVKNLKTFIEHQNELTF